MKDNKKYIKVAYGFFVLFLFLIVTSIEVQGVSATDPINVPNSTSTGLNGSNNINGLIIEPKYNVILQNVTKFSLATPTIARLRLIINGSDLANASFVGNIATFNYNLTQGVKYYLVADNGTGSYTRAWNGSPSFPYLGTNINLSGNIIDGANGTAHYVNIQKVQSEFISATGLNFSITLTDSVFSDTICNFTATINGTIYNSNISQCILQTNIPNNQSINYTIILSSNNYNSKTLSYNVSTNLITTLDPVYNNRLTINVSNYTGGLISSYVVNVTNINLSISNSYTFNNPALVNLTQNYVYRIVIDATNYALDNFTYTPTTTTAIIDRTLQPSNSLSFQMFTESGVALTSLTSISLTSTSGNYNGTTNATGGKQFTLINPGVYTAQFSNTGYQPRQLQVNVVDRTTQSFNVYMNNGTAILFNYKDYGGRALEGVNLKIYTYVNNNLTLVGEYLSDVTGRVQWYATSNTYYFFTNTLSGYTNNNFYLNPVLFSSYDIPMGVSTAGQYTPTAYLSYNPSSFYTGRTGNLTIRFESPYSSLTSYQYAFTYCSSTINNSGSTSIGQTFSNAYSIDCEGIATLSYTWFLNNGATQSGSYNFVIVKPWQNKTIMNIGDKSYGMLLGDKVFWLTLIMIVVMGSAYLAVGMEGSLLFGGILLLIMTTSGYIPITAIPLYYVFGFAIIIILVFKGYGGK